MVYTRNVYELKMIQILFCNTTKHQGDSSEISTEPKTMEDINKKEEQCNTKPPQGQKGHQEVALECQMKTYKGKIM